LAKQLHATKFCLIKERIKMKNSKSIIVYFSRKGSNYVGGSIIDLSIGNTEVIANKIEKLTGSDMFEIETVKSYPKDYTETTNVAQKELRENNKPELTKKVSDIDSYDVIYLGYPNWWGTMPMPVFSFLEQYDLTGKTIVPFCTHEGSALGRSEDDIKKTCPKSKVLDGLAIRGKNVKDADKEVSDWLKKIEMTK
jgi:flavodoxin